MSAAQDIAALAAGAAATLATTLSDATLSPSWSFVRGQKLGPAAYETIARRSGRNVRFATNALRLDQLTITALVGPTSGLAKFRGREQAIVRAHFGERPTLGEIAEMLDDTARVMDRPPTTRIVVER